MRPRQICVVRGLVIHHVGTLGSSTATVVLRSTFLVAAAVTLEPLVCALVSSVQFFELETNPKCNSCCIPVATLASLGPLCRSHLPRRNLVNPLDASQGRGLPACRLFPLHLSTGVSLPASCVHLCFFKKILDVYIPTCILAERVSNIPPSRRPDAHAGTAVYVTISRYLPTLSDLNTLGPVILLFSLHHTRFCRMTCS